MNPAVARAHAESLTQRLLGEIKIKRGYGSTSEALTMQISSQLEEFVPDDVESIALGANPNQDPIVLAVSEKVLYRCECVTDASAEFGFSTRLSTFPLSAQAGSVSIKTEYGQAERNGSKPRRVIWEFDLKGLPTCLKFETYRSLHNERDDDEFEVFAAILCQALGCPIALTTESNQEATN